MPTLIGRPALFLDELRPAIRVPARLALVLIATGVALGLVELLAPVLGRPHYFLAFAAIVATSVAAGTRHGALTTLLFAAAYAFWFLEPRGSLAVASRPQLAGLVGYTLTGLFVAWVGGSLRHAYARLRQQAAALARVQEQREDLLRTLTHDLRTPLSSIALNAKLLQRAPEVGPEVARRAAGIERSVGAAAAMLEDLVEVAKLESGSLDLARERVDLARFAGDLCERLPGDAAASRVKVDVGPDVPPLHADPRRLERVLLNLLSNALKYAPEGTPVRVRAAPAGREVVLSITDEGPGVAEADLPFLFDKYFRAAAVKSTDGLGLGLYISRLLVEAHGGRIWATSEEGRGTTFHVALPAAVEPRP